MGINIGYKGSLDDPLRLSEALRAIRTFCGRIKWPYDNLSEVYSGILVSNLAEPKGGARQKAPLIEERARGVVIHPPGTESVLLVFNPRGRLCHYREVPAELVVKAVPGATHYVEFPLWSKTTGCPRVHGAICFLLRLLKDRFMSDLEVTDDTGFWNNWSLGSLYGEHEAMGVLLDVMSRPESINTMLQALGLPEVAKDTKILVNHPIPVVRRKKAKAKGESVH